jgi:methyltransferase NSUN6
MDADVVAHLGERGPSIMASLSSPPPITCIRVNTLKVSIDEGRAALGRALNPFFERLTSEGREVPTITPCESWPWAFLVPHAPAVPDDGLPMGLQVIVDRKCGEAVLRGADIFARGVLSCSRGVVPGLRVQISAALDVPAPLHGKAAISDTRGTAPCGWRGRRVVVGIGEACMDRASMLECVGTC